MKPIIFSTPMVKAILEGKKTQTRRMITNADILIDINYNYVDVYGLDRHGRQKDNDMCSFPYTKEQLNKYMIDNFAPYQPGDVLWVREAFDYDGFWGTEPVLGEIVFFPNGKYLYKADGVKSKTRWRPSIHMPREAARLFLRVKNVRVERVQDITEEDAKAEGVIPFPYDPEGDCWNDGKYKTAFEYLWNTLHGWNPNAWGRNDWVWVIEFERIQESEVEESEVRNRN